MEKMIFKIFFIALISIIQIVFLSYFNINGIWPNIILIFSLYFVLINDLKTSLLFVVIGGLALDMVSPFKFALNTMTMLSLNIIVFFMAHKYFSEVNALTSGIITALSLVIYNLVLLTVSGNFFFNILYTDLIFGFVLGVLVYVILNRFIKSSQMVKNKNEYIRSI